MLFKTLSARPFFQGMRRGYRLTFPARSEASIFVKGLSLIFSNCSLIISPSSYRLYLRVVC